MPNKELFNQVLKQELSLTDRFATGVPGQLGADNILFSDYIRSTGLTLIRRFSNVTTQQVFTVTAKSKILDIDFESTGTTTIKVSKIGDGDIIPEQTITSSDDSDNAGGWKLAVGQTLTIDISGSPVTITIRYIHNYYSL